LFQSARESSSHAAVAASKLPSRYRRGVWDAPVVSNRGVGAAPPDPVMAAPGRAVILTSASRPSTSVLLDTSSSRTPLHAPESNRHSTP